ncbi:MAG: hypothetical protein ACOWWO_01870 [Peptococcaceae bacterium]
MLKKILIFIVLISLSFTLVGCEEQETNEDLISATITRIETNTQKAIEEKNSQLARDTWSEITEYSIKAEKLADENLRDSLGKLASTYVKLVKYCEDGDPEILAEFEAEFQKAAEELKELILEAEKDEL